MYVVILPNCSANALEAIAAMPAPKECPVTVSFEPDWRFLMVATTSDSTAAYASWNPLCTYKPLMGVQC